MYITFVDPLFFKKINFQDFQNFWDSLAYQLLRTELFHEAMMGFYIAVK